MAEVERYLPTLLAPLERKLESRGIGDVPIVMRMTGCPNGCARPYNAELGLVGRAPGIYDLYLGGNRAGTRLATLVATNLREQAIIARAERLFERFASEREPGTAWSRLVDGDAALCDGAGLQEQQPVEGGAHGAPCRAARRVMVRI